jgi:hypothetical protein
MSLVSKVDTPHIAKEQSLEAQGLDFGDIGFLPIDIGRFIFTFSKTNLDSMALVSKNWVALTDEDKFLKILRDITPEISGVKEWKECAKVIKIVDEIRIPREAYRIIEEGALLTFIPQEVTVINENKEEEVVPLNSLKAIGKLFKKPITDLETCFSGVWEEVIEQERPLQKPHWVCLSTQAIGHDKFSFVNDDQLKCAEDEDKKAYGDNSNPASNQNKARANFGKQARENSCQQIIKVSELIDTVASALLAYAKSENKMRLFPFDYAEGPGNMVRVMEKIDKSPLWLCFERSGLHIESGSPDCADGCIGIACARKSFGP